MKLSKLISFVDTHAAGCPIRIITGGMPALRGETMLDKMLDMEKRYDHLRSMTMCEPRGHRNMVGAVLTEPTCADADVGLFYIDPKGYAPMCGAGSIALAKALVELGYVEMREPVTEVRMETPSGIVHGFAEVKDGHVVSAKFRNIESFVYRTGLTTDWKGRSITYNILYGGNFFVSLSLEQFGMEFKAENSDAIAELGMALLKQINQEIKVVHPMYPGITFLNDLQFTVPTYEEDGKKIYRNTVVFGAKQVDRSPCGTGSCARMAYLYSTGELKLHEPFIHESILGSRFVGEIDSVREKDGYTYVTCLLGGDTHIVATGSFLADHGDPMSDGFLL